MRESIGISKFYKLNNCPGSGNSYTLLGDEDLIAEVRRNWEHRKPGRGETGLDRKVVVPIPAGDFVETLFFTGFTRDLRLDTPVKAKVARRKGQPETEAPSIQTYIPAEYARKVGLVNVVCYSAAALLENDGVASPDAPDWEIVTIICSPVDNEFMSPMTMARNFLELPGGTKSIYTAKEFAEAAVYWSGRIRVMDDRT